MSLARAFVNHPPLLLADEPTGNLDPETSIGIMQLLYRMNRTGHDGDRRHARQRDGGPDAPPRDRAAPGPRRARRGRPGMYWAEAVKPFFFLREALRALRRNAAPSLAAVATVLITTLVLGVFIPVVRAATAKTNEVRNKIELEVFINDDASRAEVAELGQHDPRHPPRREHRVRQQGGGAADPQAQAGRQVLDHRGPARQPAAALLPDQARRPAERRRREEQPRAGRDQRRARARSAPRSRRSRTARTTPRRSSRPRAR